MYLFPFDRVNKGEQIALYGMGKIGNGFRVQICEMNFCKIVLMVDKNKREYDAPEKLRGFSDKLDKVIVCTDYPKWSKEIHTFLQQECGISSEKIVSPPFVSYEECCRKYTGMTNRLYFGQYGEDVIVKNIFDLIGIPSPRYCDIGCNVPCSSNNTYKFYSDDTCRGVLVDPDADVIDFCKQVRKADICLNVAIGNVEGNMPYYKLPSSGALNSLSRKTVQNSKEYFHLGDDIEECICHVMSLQHLCDEYFDGFLPELLSLDVENYEIKVLTSAHEKAFAKNIVMVIERSGLSTEIMDFAQNNGYFLYMNTIGNHVFVKSQYREQLLGI